MFLSCQPETVANLAVPRTKCLPRSEFSTSDWGYNHPAGVGSRLAAADIGLAAAHSPASGLPERIAGVAAHMADHTAAAAGRIVEPDHIAGLADRTVVAVDHIAAGAARIAVEVGRSLVVRKAVGLGLGILLALLHKHRRRLRLVTSHPFYHMSSRLPPGEAWSTKALYC